MEWIKVEDRLPEGKQEVLTYLYEADYEVENFEVFNYFKVGDVMDDCVLDFNIENPEARLLDALFDKTERTTLICKEEGFYFLNDGWVRHKGVSHWAELIAPVK